MRQRSGSQRCYQHQAEAIEELLSPTARPVVVTTGTGSGKTECFLLPILQNAIEDVTRSPASGLTWRPRATRASPWPGTTARRRRRTASGCAGTRRTSC